MGRPRLRWSAKSRVHFQQTTAALPPRQPRAWRCAGLSSLDHTSSSWVANIGPSETLAGLGLDSTSEVEIFLACLAWLWQLSRCRLALGRTAQAIHQDRGSRRERTVSAVTSLFVSDSSAQFEPRLAPCLQLRRIGNLPKKDEFWRCSSARKPVLRTRRALACKTVTPRQSPGQLTLASGPCSPAGSSGCAEESFSIGCCFGQTHDWTFPRCRCGQGQTSHEI